MVGNITSLICAIITFCMALFQLSLTFGLPFGEYTLGGTHKILPHKMRIISATCFCTFSIVALSYLQNGQFINLVVDGIYSKIIIIIHTLFLGYAIIWNFHITKSNKEKYVMTPISAVTFMFSLITLLSKL